MLSLKERNTITKLLNTENMGLNDYKDILSMAIGVFEDDKNVSRDLAFKVRNDVQNFPKPTVKSYELYNMALHFLAQKHLDFDSYLLYVEKERDPEERFYLPRRRQMKTIVMSMQSMIDNQIDLLTISMPPGTGKAQPLYSKVLTPDGFVNMGDIKVGDTVISGTGAKSTVLGVYPQGRKPVYEITLSNCAKTRCSDEHLWTVWVLEEGTNGIIGTAICDTKELIKNFRKKPNEYLIAQLDAETKDGIGSLRIILDIEYIGEEECQCIYIDNPSHLYVTDNYIITHNTTLEEFFASYVMGLYPNKPNLFSSFSGFMTRMFYDAVKNIIMSNEYCWKDVFPTVEVESTDAKETSINLGKKNAFKTLTCRPINASLTGNTRSEGYLFVDDLVSGIEEAMSKERLDKLWQKYGTDLKSRKKQGCKEIHIATRWSVHDPIGRLGEMYKYKSRSRFLEIPDINPHTGLSNFDYDYGVGFDAKYFHDIELTMDDVSYRCLYKAKPIEREGILYHPEELRRYLGDLPLEEPDGIWGVCDTKDTGTDYNALLIFYQYGEDYYLHDLVFKNVDPKTLDELNSDALVRNNVQECQFESNKEGSRTADKVDELVKKKGGRCHITKKYTTQNKETKIIVNSAWVKQHVIFKDPKCYSMKEDYGVFIGQVCTYTQRGKNRWDDSVDALAQFALYRTAQRPVPTRVVSRAVLGF